MCELCLPKHQHTHAWRREDNRQESDLIVHHVGPGDGTQVSRLGYKHPYPLLFCQSDLCIFILTNTSEQWDLFPFEGCENQV